MNKHSVYLGGMLAVAVVATTAMTMGGTASTQDTGEGLDWHTTITIEKNGDRVATFENTLTDQGQNWILDQISGTSVLSSNDLDNATFISVGNGTDVAAGDTILDKEITCCGLSRVSGSTTTFGPGEFQVQTTFTASQDVGVVNTTGLNWGSGGTNTLISGGSFSTEANILTDDQLTVTHNITIS